MLVRRRLFFACFLAYLLLVGICLGGLASKGDLSFGRNPLRNLEKTVVELSRPSFLDVWFGNPKLEYRSDDGTLLRTENRREVEKTFLVALAGALWVTFQIATLGSLLGSVLAFPLGLLAAKSLRAPSYLANAAKLLLDMSRSVHTLVFGLLFVGIFGLGPVAGILAIAAHSLGTFGKLYAESIEALDMNAVEAVRGVGATPTQVFFLAVWPAVLPQFISTNLYVWEYNTRDSTVLGLIGAGGLGLLISEAISLFQWGRLATILLVVIAFVMLFDTVSRRIRSQLL